MNLLDYIVCLFITNCTTLLTEGPSQVHLALGDDPDSMTVAWSDVMAVPQSFVRWGLEEDDLTFQSVGQLRRFTNSGREIFTYWAVMSNLKPDTRYYYQVGSENRISSIHSFKTFPFGTEWQPRIALFGDLGLTNGRATPILNEKAVSGDFDIVLHIGDIAYDMNYNRGIVGDEFMLSIEPMTSRIPYMVAPGNHEYFPVVGDGGLNCQNRFKMPGDSNDMYTFTVGPIRFLTISTEFYYGREGGSLAQVNKQRDWLVKVLSQANQPENRMKHPWIIVLGHRPLYCSNAKFGSCPGGTTWLRTGDEYSGRGLEDILYQHGVDIMFAGHNHHYERSFPVYNLQTFDSPGAYSNPKATIYFVSGAPGNWEQPDSFQSNPPKWSAFRNQDYGYTMIKPINGTHLLIQQLAVPNGTIIDSVMIIQTNHGPFGKLSS